MASYSKCEVAAIDELGPIRHFAKDIGPLCDLMLNVFCCEIGSCLTRRDDTDVVAALAKRGIGERLIESCIDSVNRLRRRALGSHHGNPSRCFVTLQSQLVE